MGDAAVSPLIATLLMVAITIVLSAVVYFFARELEEPPKGAPVATFQPQDDRGLLVMLRIDGDGQWSDFSIRLDQVGDLGLNSMPSGADALPAAGEWYPIAGGTGGPTDHDVRNGETITLCVDGGPLPNVDVRIRHEDTKRLLLEHTFPELPSC